MDKQTATHSSREARLTRKTLRWTQGSLDEKKLKECAYVIKGDSLEWPYMIGAGHSNKDYM